LTEQLALAAAQLEISPEQRAQALHLIRKWGRDIGDIRALRAAGIRGTQGQLRRLLEGDDDLRDDIARARGRAPETIRDEIRRRAIEGVDEPVFYKGDVVGHVRKYDSGLLQMMAKAHLPEYREKLEVTGDVQAPVEVAGARITGITDVFALARAVGVGLGEGLRAGATGEPLPAAPDVLPDPRDG
jgi:hypothetical protein